MTKPLKMTIVGCGRILGKHLDAISRLPDLELVGVCDTIMEKATAAASRSGVPAYQNALEMVRALRPDVTAILVESGSHAEVACAVAPHTRFLVVEKPMALTLEEADRMIDTCEHAGVGLFVVKQNRYNQAVRKLRQALEGERFGKLVMGTVRVRWCRDQAYYDQAGWRGTWRHDGGVFANQASHHIDLLQWMMGPVESVQAYTQTRLVDIETEDVGTAILRFTSGALGIIEATTATRPKDLEGSLSILGERGSVVIAGFAVNELQTWNFVDPIPDDETVWTSSENPPDVYGFGHGEFYRDVIACIYQRKRPMLDGLEGRKSLELITALYEAAATGTQVRLRYVPRNVPLGR